MLCILLSVAIGGCSDDSRKEVAPMTRYTLEHDGLEREYFVFLPSSYDNGEQHPIALFMHGYGSSATGTEAEVSNGITRYAEEFGYVMVFPQSTWFMSDKSPEERWEVSSWNHISDGFDKGPEGPICTADAAVYPCPPECGSCGQCGWASCHDDVGFLKKLVAKIATDFTVDSDRVYISGFSNGAMMANRIACEASELFAAVVLVGGRVESGFECMPTGALPLLQMNGGEDTAVPFDGRVNDAGYFFASTNSIAEHWNDGAACATEKTEWTSPAIPGETVRCSIACPDTDRESIDCLWPEGNHRWPGTPGFRGSNGFCVTELQATSMPDQAICIAPDPSQEVWGSRLMFEFFDRAKELVPGADNN
ncbi:MAG: prolyl oligopeptidase family serine peptidase [Gammaproteobacteria bacterium]|nr:prolyl oligopeptidase family serine peptidase [Gammaproteobacteria bacterium]